MKADIYEYEQAFQLCLTPETLKETAILARWSLNAKAKMEYRTMYVDRDGTFSAELGWGKRRDFMNEIKR